MSYNLINDGDRVEKEYWDKFIHTQFPSYEKFWIKNVIPLTNRPVDIHLKTDYELSKIGKSANEICLAQLHYSILKHLARTFDLLSSQDFNLDNLIEGMVRLNGALDIAFELLERFNNPTKYNTWLDKKNNSDLGGKEARENWQRNNRYPLQKIKNYRNHLIHGRMLPGISGTNYYLPKIGLEKKYFDWRLITNSSNNQALIKDLLPAKKILEQAWTEALDYLEGQWKIVLLK